MYKAELIAEYFINKYGSQGNITPMKLIKLVYIAHGWCLGLTGKPLITENPEAWKYGPVIPTLYSKYKSYRNRPITANTTSTDYLGIGEYDKQFLDRIWTAYGNEDGLQLSRRTHQPGTPWSKVWDRLKEDPMRSMQIGSDLIKEHYEVLAGNTRSNNT